MTVLQIFGKRHMLFEGMVFREVVPLSDCFRPLIGRELEESREEVRAMHAAYTNAVMPREAIPASE